MAAKRTNEEPPERMQVHGSFSKKLLDQVEAYSAVAGGGSRALVVAELCSKGLQAQMATNPDLKPAMDAIVRARIKMRTGAK